MMVPCEKEDGGAQTLMDTLVPTVPFDSRKKRRIIKRHAKAWEWRHFASSAAPTLVLSHWAPRAEDPLADYPFSKFNRKTELLRYTDAEYAALAAPSANPHLSDDEEGPAVATLPDDDPAVPAVAEAAEESPLEAAWDREMTDALLDLCAALDLRWPVIMDRFASRFPEAPFHLEDLKERFYRMQTAVAGARPEAASLVPRDFAYSREHALRRRVQLETFFSRTKCETEAEKDLLQQSQQIEGVLRKISQEAERVVPQAQASLAVAVFDMEGYKKRLRDIYIEQASDSSYLSSKITQNRYDVLFNYLPEVRTGRPGRAYLRSTALHTPIQIGTKMGKRVDSALTELGVDLKPMPTQLCGMAFEALRKDLVSLIELHSLLTRKIAHNQLLKERVRQLQLIDINQQNQT